jgi:hypothetical protein
MTDSGELPTIGERVRVRYLSVHVVEGEIVNFRESGHGPKRRIFWEVRILPEGRKVIEADLARTGHSMPPDCPPYPKFETHELRRSK